MNETVLNKKYGLAIAMARTNLSHSLLNLGRLGCLEEENIQEIILFAETFMHKKGILRHYKEKKNEQGIYWSKY